MAKFSRFFVAAAAAAVFSCGAGAVTVEPPLAMELPDDVFVPVLNSPDVSIPRPIQRSGAAPISPRDRAAMEAVKRWEENGTADALVGPGGEIRFPYNYSRPTITCSPLHVCTIRLIAGEAIVSLALGDSVRWIAEQTVAGDTPVVLVKPTQGGVSTNMVITTDAGRVYYMHLVGSSKEYMPMVGFFDPAAMSQQAHAQAMEMQKLRARVEAAERAAEKARAEAERRAAEYREKTVVAEMPADAFDPTKLDFSMTCKPNSRAAADFVPTRVFSTKTHTFVLLPKSLEGKDLPAVFRRSPAGTIELVNARRSGNYFVIDGVPDEISLALDVGKDARIVDCVRDK